MDNNNTKYIKVARLYRVYDEKDKKYKVKIEAKILDLFLILMLVFPTL